MTNIVPFGSSGTGYEVISSTHCYQRPEDNGSPHGRCTWLGLKNVFGEAKGGCKRSVQVLSLEGELLA